jgi:hypothetical protein
MDFEQNILVHIYYDGIILLEKEEKYFQIKLNIQEFSNYMNETCEVFKYKIEEQMKNDLIQKLKSKIKNVVEISRKYKIHVKNILHTRFINNRTYNIDIIWSPSAMKEFNYVPIKHYLDHPDDSLTLKVKGIKFQNQIK